MPGHTAQAWQAGISRSFNIKGKYNISFRSGAYHRSRSENIMKDVGGYMGLNFSMADSASQNSERSAYNSASIESRRSNSSPT